MLEEKNEVHLSEQEIDQIVDKVCDKLEKRLYLNVGKGIFAFVWKGVLVGLLMIAAWGAGVHGLIK